MEEYRKFKIPIRFNYFHYYDIDKEDTLDDIYKFLYGCHNTKIELPKYIAPSFLTAEHQNSIQYNNGEDLDILLYGKIHYLGSLSGPDLIFNIVQEKYDPYYKDWDIISSQNFRIREIIISDTIQGQYRQIVGDYSIAIDVLVNIEWDRDLNKYILEESAERPIHYAYENVTRFELFKSDLEECLYC